MSALKYKLNFLALLDISALVARERLFTHSTSTILEASNQMEFPQGGREFRVKGEI